MKTQWNFRTRICRCAWCAITALGSLSAATQARAEWYDDLARSVAESTTSVDFRYRYEFVDSDALDKHANASTLRSRLTWTSADLGRFSYGMEAGYVAVVGPERYNSLSNDKTSYPVVADPDGFDLNQLYMRYTKEAATGTLGRQRINQGSQRFVGSVAWRQNEQTFDAVRAQFGRTVRFDYAYVDRVNRVFGPKNGVQPRKWDGNTHLLRADYTLAEGHELSAYGYLMDFENDNGPVNSNATFGLEYSGALGPLRLSAAVARQTEYEQNPVHYNASYLLLEGKYALEGVTATLGYEVLGSDSGDAGFRTPLATLHKFQGWADVFAVTPADGVRDAYLGVNGKLGKLDLGAVYHSFEADAGGASDGAEVDLVAAYPVHRAVNVQLKYARYDADDYAVDVNKLWVTLQLKL